MTSQEYRLFAGKQHPKTALTPFNSAGFASAPPSPPLSLRAIGPERAIAQAHAAVGGAFPRFIETAVGRVVEQLVTLGRGPLVDALAGVLEGRQRGLKEEARKNTASALAALLFGMDAASLFIRTPKAGGLPERHRWQVYDARAFGPQIEGERSVKRTFRASSRLQGAGLLQVREVGEIRGDQFRSHVAHKRLTLELFRLLGLLNAWKKLQRDRQQEQAREKARRAERLAALSLRKQRRAADPAATHSTPTVQPEASPGAPRWQPPQRSPDELAAFLAAQRAAAGF